MMQMLTYVGTSGALIVSRPQDEYQAHYDLGFEQRRLFAGVGELERIRTQELILRHLPARRCRILDVGGAAGVHALWLAGLGHEVHLVDAVPLHVRQAAEASRKQPGNPLASVTQGDARRLDVPAGSFDVVLLLGPLYHLVEKKDRLKALREARRVLRPGGFLFAAGISRFASLHDGLFRNLIERQEFATILERDLRDGQHRNPGNNPQYFTTAYFHRPDELASEIRRAGFDSKEVFAVEGPMSLLPNFEELWRERRRYLLSLLRKVEKEPSLLGVSAHLLGVARKPRTGKAT